MLVLSHVPASKYRSGPGFSPQIFFSRYILGLRWSDPVLGLKYHFYADSSSPALLSNLQSKLPIQDLHCRSRASLVDQLVKNLPAMWKTRVQSLGWEDPWRRERLPAPVFWYSPWDRKQSDTTEQLTLHFTSTFYFFSILSLWDLFG